MRGSPSTTCVSFANALRLSFVRAFSAAFATLAAWCFACWSWRFRSIVSTSRRAYQTSRLRGSASFAHPLAVRARPRRARPSSAPPREVAVAARDLEARREPFHVPLERSGQRLVEVVEVEDERSLGRGEAADVREVGVAAQLHLEAGARRRGEVVRHDGRRPAVEGERRDEHAPVADRDELRDAGGRLRLEDRDGIAVVGDLELGVARPRALGTGGAASCGAFRGREVRHRRSGAASMSLFSSTATMGSPFAAQTAPRWRRSCELPSSTRVARGRLQHDDWRAFTTRVPTTRLTMSE